MNELITLWHYVRCHLVSATYKIEEEQVIFGDARFFTSLHRQQLFQLAQLRYEERAAWYTHPESETVLPGTAGECAQPRAHYVERVLLTLSHGV